jgi:hypothetical protein
MVLIHLGWNKVINKLKKRRNIIVIELNIEKTRH